MVVLCGVVMARRSRSTAFGNCRRRPFGLTWDQVHLVLGFQAALMMLAFLAQNRPIELGIGFWLMLLAAIALFVGALQRLPPPAPRPASI